MKIRGAAGGHALAVGVARARRRRGFLIGGEHGRRLCTPCPSLVVGPAATLPAPAPTTPEVEVGNATTLPAPVPEPEETTPLQDYATYEATKDISDPNTAAVAGAAAAQVAGALQ